MKTFAEIVEKIIASKCEDVIDLCAVELHTTTDMYIRNDDSDMLFDMAANSEMRELFKITWIEKSN